MSKITITEALAELNLIKKKIEKKKPDILNNLLRYEHVADPFLKEGGSQQYIAAEIQSINSLRERFVKIRSAIAKINTETHITVNNVTRTINEWLNWKRDQATDDLLFRQQISATLKTQMDRLANSSQVPVYKDDKGENHFVKWATNTSYSEHLKAAEEIQAILDTLDGQLSLKNATIVIEI